MVLEHNFEDFPELTNNQLNTLQFLSPHKQYTEDFEAVVEKVTDGDTVTILTSERSFSFPLRLLDIDAPELNEGGEEVKEWLAQRLTGETVTVLIDKDNRVGKYGRLLGKILHAGVDVGEEMIHLGMVARFGEKNESNIPPFDKLMREVKI